MSLQWLLGPANDLATHFGLYHTAFLCQLAHDPTSQINQVVVVVTFIWQASVARTLRVQVYFKFNSQVAEIVPSCCTCFLSDKGSTSPYL